MWIASVVASTLSTPSFGMATISLNRALYPGSVGELELVTVSSSESYSTTEFRKLSGLEAYSWRTLKELVNLFFAMGVVRESLYEYFRPVL